MRSLNVGPGVVDDESGITVIAHESIDVPQWQRNLLARQQTTTLMSTRALRRRVEKLRRREDRQAAKKGTV